MVVSSLDGILSGNNTKVFFGQVGLTRRIRIDDQIGSKYLYWM